MTDEKTTRPDPLDRLRRLGSSGSRGHELTDHGHELTGIADAWLRERDQLRAKLRDMTADRDEWRRTYKDVPPDIMSTSMPLPLDADGYAWDSYEEEFIDPDGKRLMVGEDGTLDYSQENWFIRDSRGRSYATDACRHVERDIPRLRKVRGETCAECAWFDPDVFWDGRPSGYGICGRDGSGITRDTPACDAAQPRGEGADDGR